MENHSEEIALYQTAHGCSLQNPVSSRIEINFGDIAVSLGWYEFKALRNQIKSIRLEDLLFDLSEKSDVLALHIPGKPLLFTLCNFVQFKELIDGTMFSLELRSMLFEVLGEFEVV